ncbi:MAG: ornithine carbamoyltransferase [Actinomycetota bacterium]
MRHFTDISALDTPDLLDILRRSRIAPADLGRPAEGEGVALIFEKPSNRTRQSMEIAVVQLGGHPVYTRGEEVGFDVREPVEDIARILSGYHAVIAARVFSHDVIDRLVQSSAVPILNMLSDRSHPLQALADVLTMTDEFGSIEGRTVAYVGDFNNVARSLVEACVMLGSHCRIGCPQGYSVGASELERMRALGSGTIEVFVDPIEAVEGAHAVHTDTWVSMGQEAEKESRRQIFSNYRVDEALMNRAASDGIFMHCLPAYRGFEVTAEVIDGPRSRVIAQGHNRLDSARGVLSFLLDGRDSR